MTAWPSATLNALSSERRVQQAGGNGAGTVSRSVQIRHAVALPDHVLMILSDGSSLPAPGQFECLYSTANSTQLRRRPLSVAALPDGPSLVHCPAGPSGMAVSLSLSQSPPVTPVQWDQLVYTALLDSRDNSTVVFAKGMNLRPGRLGVPSRYECVFGRDLSKPKFVVTSPVVSAAQETFRCVTPLRIRRYLRMTADGNINRNSDSKPMLVSIRTKGRGSSTLPSIAQPEPLPRYNRHRQQKVHSMCVCTMLRNQARFLREWIDLLILP